MNIKTMIFILVWMMSGLYCEIAKAGDAPSIGNANAKVTITEYTDYQCPYCAESHQTMLQLLKKYNGQIRLVYKNYPLNIHPWAEHAAVAAICVNTQSTEQFWKLTDLLFAQQKEITKETFSQTVLDFGKTAGLDLGQLQACMNDRTTLEKVKADLEEADLIGLSGAPSFMINGRPVDGAKDIDYFSKIIDAELVSKP